MIEAEMIFALGFCTAALLSFACLPAVWQRAMRLSRRRLEQLVPLSGEEVAAERDALRADFALEHRRLEQKLERAEHLRRETAVELGRRDMRVAALDAEAARGLVEIAALSAANADLTRELRAAEAAAGAAALALFEGEGVDERQRDLIGELQSGKRQLETAIDEGRTTVASLETRVLGLQARLADLTAERDASRAHAERAVARAEAAERDRDAAREAGRAFAEQRNALRTRVDELSRALEQSQAEGHQRAARHAAAEVERASNLLEIGRLKADLATERERSAALMSKQAAATAARLEDDHRHAVAIEGLRAEKAALESTMAALREGGQPGTTGVSRNDIAAVRKAIAAVADDVLRASAQPTPSGSLEARASPARKAETTPLDEARALN